MVNNDTNENTAPLGLPEGSIRSILALVIIIGSFALKAVERIDFTEFMAMTGPITALYFGQYIKSPQG